MALEDLPGVFEMFKDGFPYSFLYFLPIVLILSSPVSGSQNFTVYRMQHYDLQAVNYGSRSTLVGMEAKHVEARMITRRCVIAKLADMTASRYRDIVAQNAGALLVILPDASSVEADAAEAMIELEREFLSQSTLLPVYFAFDSPQLSDIYSRVMASSVNDVASTALKAMWTEAFGDGYQMSVSTTSAKQLSDFQVTNLHGLLVEDAGESIPTVAFVAHYDAFGVAPSLSFGADSNGSGVAALIELARLFSLLYASAKTAPRFNIMFLLTGAGKFNYFGTKRWLDEQQENGRVNLLTDVHFVVCLDSLARGDELYMHVSKPPKEGSPAHAFQQALGSSLTTSESGVKFEMVYKKINLGDPTLAWEHEQFSIHKLSAFTMSHYSTHREPSRSSVLDTRTSVDTKKLARNTKLIAEAVGKYVLGLQNSSAQHVDIFTGDLEVSEAGLSQWLTTLTEQPRPSQLLDRKHQLLSSLEQTLAHYLRGGTQRTFYAADKKDPEFIFYGNLEETMYAFSVKPAVFDLILMAFIGSYVGLVYLAAMNFGLFESMLMNHRKKKLA